jgi:hypothetical protein
MPHERPGRSIIKPIAAAVVCLGAMIASAQAQTLGENIVLQYGVLKKSNTAAKLCVSEVGRMQVVRNDHYDSLLHARAENPDAPTIEEMSDVLAQTRQEDEALKQKREECAPVLEQLVAAAKELRRNCAAYTAPITNNEPAPATDTMAITICRGSAKSGDGDKPGNQ